MRGNSVRRTMHLAPPLAALGIGGALAMADFLRVGCMPGDDRLAISLVVLVPLLSAALGFAFSARIEAGVRVSQWVTCATTCACGSFLGAAIGACLWGDRGFPMGVANGLAFGAAFSLPFSLVVAAVQRIGRARPASVVDRSDRLLVAAIVATVVAVGAGVASLHRSLYPFCGIDPTAVPVIAPISLFTLILIVGLQAHRVGRASAVLARSYPVEREELFPALPCVDFGLGDDLRAEYTAAGRSAYRDHHPAAVRLARGDASLARRALVRALSLEWGMLLASLASSAIAAASAAFATG